MPKRRPRLPLPPRRMPRPTKREIMPVLPPVFWQGGMYEDGSVIPPHPDFPGPAATPSGIPMRTLPAPLRRPYPLPVGDDSPRPNLTPSGVPNRPLPMYGLPWRARRVI